MKCLCKYTIYTITSKYMPEKQILYRERCALHLDNDHPRRSIIRA